MTVVKFNQMQRDEKNIVGLRDRIDDTTTTIHLSEHSVRIERLHRIRSSNGGDEDDHDPIFPTDFYRGTMYGIPLDPQQIASSTNVSTYKESLRDLRIAIEQKLAVQNIFPASFQVPPAPESKGGDNIEVWQGFAIQFLHKPGGYNHDEHNEWHVMWICRLFNLLYAYKWQPHIWGGPFGADTYDPADPLTFKHSSMIETIIPSNHAWRVLYSKVPVTSRRE